MDIIHAIISKSKVFFLHGVLVKQKVFFFTISVSSI